MNISPLLKASRLFLTKNSPAILTGIAAAGVLTTAVMAVRATPAADHALQEDFQKNGPAETQLEVVKRYIQVGWRFYVPATLVGVGTISAIIGVNSIHTHRNLALAGAYSLLEQGAKEYQEKVLETVGEKKELQIHEAIAQDRLDKNPVGENVVFLTGHGETLTYDSLSGRYFKSDIELLRQAQNNLNVRLINGTWLALNELYNEIGLDSIKLGDDIGWVPDNLLELKFTSKLATDGTPCLVLDYYVDPKLDYYQSIQR